MVDERTMIRATFDRLQGLPDTADPWVVCNVEHRHLVAGELAAAGLPPGNVILEPVGRNTAPAAAAAALIVAEQDPTGLMLLLPADHVITDDSAFHQAVVACAEQAGRGKLATFGIVPEYPETGYGYIEVGEAVNDEVAIVAAFVEKPDLATAERYVAGGNHLWNSGMFLFSATRYLDELARLAPEMAEAVRAAVGRADRAGAITLDAGAFSASPADSIDFAVMEHTDSAVVVPLAAGWSDVGSWAALWQLAVSDSGDNVLVGDVTAVDVTGSYLRAESRMVAALGVANLVVVETADAVLVASRERSQEVKAIVDRLVAAGREEAEQPHRVTEQWGTSQRIFGSGAFTLRLLTVEPTPFAVSIPAGDRPRTWICAAGSGMVEFGSESVDISTTSAAIPPGVVVGVRPGSETALEIIELTRDID